MPAVATRPVTEAAVRGALDGVLDPELDEPLTDLGFVRSVTVTGADDGTPVAVTVHLRLPTSFCSPNFAWIMASDAKDAVAALPGVGRVVVELDDHHDSDLINRGLAADAGYLGTFGHEAEHGLDELRETFRRKAHTAAMERCLTAVLRADPELREEDAGVIRLGDVPAGAPKEALLRRRAALGLPCAATDPVLVDADGRPPAADAVPLALRRARSTRISVEGNAHFCRGLLRTRYGEAGTGPADHHHLIPLLPLTAKES